jgi:hypothetical protein
LKPAIKILKNTTKTSPGVYFSDGLEKLGYYYSTRTDPHQKPSAYEHIIAIIIKPIPTPASNPYLRVP